MSENLSFFLKICESEILHYLSANSQIRKVTIRKLSLRNLSEILSFYVKVCKFLKSEKKPLFLGKFVGRFAVYHEKLDLPCKFAR